MSRKKENCEARNKAILDEYKKLSGKKTPKGNQLYTFDAILEQLAGKFFLSETYVYKIIIGNK